MQSSIPPFIREVILENFMSYEYSRIPLGPRVNIICGPNGAGKSTILVGISVALGQTYTERSRKLAELIRRGKEIGRATVVLDNSTRGGRRPVPAIPKDTIVLSRFLRRDGEYWFELDGRAAEKTEVLRILGRLGLNPDNLLIIMHQNMVEEFSVLPSPEKLRIVEEAAGLAAYRRDVLESRRKLTRILSEEESLSKLLESAQQTLSYWKDQYQRLQTKRQLTLTKTFLERALAWKEVQEAEDRLNDLGESIKASIARAKSLESSVSELAVQLQESRSTLQKMENHAEAVYGSAILHMIRKLEGLFQIQPPMLTAQPGAEGGVSLDYQGGLIDRESVRQAVRSLSKELASESKSTSGITRGGIIGLLGAAESYADLKVDEALAKSALSSEKKLLEGMRADESQVERELASLGQNAGQKGQRISTEKTARQLVEELKLTEGHLEALADVPEDVERLFESYSKLFEEVKGKAGLVAENRAKLLDEIRLRIEKWNSVMRDLVSHTSLRYNEILSEVGASGRVELAGAQDIENAGIELHVGFRGGDLVPLNAYTQSGGERSAATVSFLLALQQFIKSPFRGIDEFDVHMDPKNREAIMHVLYATVRNSNTQYIAITPSPLTVLAEDARILTVQSVAGKSHVKEVS